jgi:hypothetical protein
MREPIEFYKLSTGQRRCELQTYIHELDVAIVLVFLLGFFLIPVLQLTAGSVSSSRRKLRYGANLRKSGKNGLADRRTQSDKQKWTVVKW